MLNGRATEAVIGRMRKVRPVISQGQGNHGGKTTELVGVRPLSCDSLQFVTARRRATLARFVRGGWTVKVTHGVTQSATHVSAHRIAGKVVKCGILVGSKGSLNFLGRKQVCLAIGTLPKGWCQLTPTTKVSIHSASMEHCHPTLIRSRKSRFATNYMEQKAETR